MSTSLFPALRLETLGKELSEFLRWWSAELVAMLPAQWRSRLHLFQERLELRLTEDALDLQVVTASGSQAAGHFVPDASDAARLLEALRANCGKDRCLVLRLAGRSVLVRDLTLPGAAEENLAQVLRYEMDRYTPFKADSVYHGFQVLGRDAGSGSPQGSPGGCAPGIPRSLARGVQGLGRASGTCRSGAGAGGGSGACLASWSLASETAQPASDAEGCRDGPVHYGPAAAALEVAGGGGAFEPGGGGGPAGRRQGPGAAGGARPACSNSRVTSSTRDSGGTP
jgi:hypothetical protein